MNKIIAIAIDEYKSENISNLKNCLNDINSISNILLEDYEYDDLDYILFNKPEQTTLSFLYQNLNQELSGVSKDDTILIIHAGHGDYNKDNRNTYWYCSDSKESDVTTWFNIRDILDFFSTSPAKHIALISDSCFSGAIFEYRRGGGVGALVKNKSRQALTSGGVEPVSDGKLGNSPFNISLQRVLKENSIKELTFTQLCEDTIKDFSEFQKQTPRYGSLSSVGDEGGTYLFNKREVISEIKVHDINIPLKINENIKINYDFKIPFFQSNDVFDYDFVNLFIRNKGYEIVNEVRLYLAEESEKEYFIKRSEDFNFELTVGYTIKRNDEKYLSIEIYRDEYFGAMHPNNYIYTVNFIFHPDRKVNLYDLIDVQDLQTTIYNWIEEYADEEQKGFLRSYAEYNYIQELNFSFDNDKLYLFFNNFLPRALQAGGILEIPLKHVRFK